MFATRVLGIDPGLTRCGYGVVDARRPSRWGRIEWSGEAGGGVKLSVRTGNTEEPDNTWSDWKRVGDDGSLGWYEADDLGCEPGPGMPVEDVVHHRRRQVPEPEPGQVDHAPA